MNGEKIDTALQVNGLAFTYAQKQIALRGVDLVVQKGDRVGLIGPNGAGKTTFFMLITGVLKPETGTIQLFGEELTQGKFRPEIGMVFQNSDDQLFSPTVRDDVAFGPQNLGMTPDAVEARVQDVLTLTGVADLADRAPHHLSGGQKRMVSIAGVLAMKPKMIIYDEPSANLDMRSRRRLIRFLEASDETMVVASHDLELILEVCDRVVLLDEGQIIVEGDPSEIMADVALMEAHGLERPHSLTPHEQAHH